MLLLKMEGESFLAFRILISLILFSKRTQPLEMEEEFTSLIIHSHPIFFIPIQPAIMLVGMEEEVIFLLEILWCKILPSMKITPLIMQVELAYLILNFNFKM